MLSVIFNIAKQIMLVQLIITTTMLFDRKLNVKVADINTSDPQNQSNHARGGNGIFGEPMVSF